MIPVMRPKLVAADKVIPYLRQIDQSRFYANRGPLVKELEARLAKLFGVDSDCIVTVNNATTGLALALIATTGQQTGTCLMQSWTFEACPVAALMAGFDPQFLDIDPATWALDPQTVLDQGTDAAAVMYATPFGRPVNTTIWEEVATRFQKPVIIDAAAGFDRLEVSSNPTVVSLHATKVLSSGEGGFVACLDRDLITRIKNLSNFGFAGNRRMDTAGLNGKMSEYSAAVGLAELEAWPQKKALFQSVRDRYDAALKDVLLLQRVPQTTGQSWITSTYNIRLPDRDVTDIADRLSVMGIETRQWWGRGCHRQPAFKNYAGNDLSVTEDFTASVLGLPFYPDLEVEAQRKVICSLREILQHL